MPQQLAHYQIEDMLGEGSFAWVYRAFDEKFERPVALKVLKPVWLSDPQAIARFKQEAKTMARLRHSHIVDVYDVGQAEGQIYLSQLLVEGETLADRLTTSSLTWDEVVKIVSDIGSALDYAHNQGIIHRDIKPQNILLDKDNQAYLGDFGLVRAVEGSTHLSSTMSMVGTAHYMAPEVWDGKKAVPASDVYALSCVVFEMLTGKVLFEGSSMAAVTKQHIVGPQFPERWPENVPQGVTDVFKRGLAEDPAERISNAGELAAQLAALNTLAKPAPPPPVVRSTEPAPAAPGAAKKGPPWLLIGGAVVVLIIVVIAFVVISNGGQPSDEVAAGPATTEVPVVVEPPQEPKPEVDTEATIAAAVAATEQAKDEIQEEVDAEATVAAAVEATTTEQAQADAQATLDALAATATAQAQATDEPEPTDTPIPEPTATPSATPTNTPEPTPAATPIPTEDTPTTESTVPVAAAGGRIAFVSDRDGDPELYIMNVDGSEQIKLTDNPTAYAWDPDLSPDGKHIVFSLYGAEETHIIHKMNIDGSGLTRLTGGTDGGPSWSPDGQQIAFVGQDDRLYTMNIDGTEVIPLTQGSGRDPSWSPDGTRITFWDVDQGMWMINKDGSGLIRLIDDAQWAAPMWSPDGQLIAFAGGWDGGIFVMNVEGSEVTRLTDFGMNAVWSPDGTQIAFESSRDGNSEIYIMDADGSNPVNITKHLADDSFPSWGR
jgi:serine/threonine-protein kinase